jgi:DNA-binding Lrp family transcriptional regulator
MDNTDIILSSFLLANSRMPYRELADQLGLSVNAVHKRIQSLVESGVIRKFTAKVSLSAVEAIHVFIFGGSQADSSYVAKEKLGRYDSIYWVAIAGGNYLYIGAYLRRITELQPLVDYIKKEANMPNPTVGIISGDSGIPPPKTSGERTLHALDLQIIGALHDNSRKAVSDVAEKLKVSAKTIRRRLDGMIKNGLIELSIEWYPDISNDIVSIFRVVPNSSVELETVDRFFKKLSPNILFYWRFSNLPNDLIAFVWTRTMKELRNIHESFERAKVFETIVPNILYTGYIFNTWRDDLPSIAIDQQVAGKKV